jgi:hypothetical protein
LLLLRCGCRYCCRQVHVATAHDGTKLAVKVQHTGLRESCAADVTTIEFLVNAVRVVFPDFNYMWLVRLASTHTSAVLFCMSAHYCNVVLLFAGVAVMSAACLHVPISACVSSAGPAMNTMRPSVAFAALLL